MTGPFPPSPQVREEGPRRDGMDSCARQTDTARHQRNLVLGHALILQWRAMAHATVEAHQPLLFMRLSSLGSSTLIASQNMPVEENKRAT